VRLLVDAQLPPKLATYLAAQGHDAIHVMSLPGAVRTPDAEIAAIADAQDRAVVTKDADFRHSHTVSGSPASLLLVATGNIRNDDLLDLFRRRLDDIEAALAGARFVELHRDMLIVHTDDGA
jgi:predicted nuclease of predicted toxin-antitoxin system